MPGGGDEEHGRRDHAMGNSIGQDLDLSGAQMDHFDLAAVQRTKPLAPRIATLAENKSEFIREQFHSRYLFR